MSAATAGFVSRDLIYRFDLIAHLVRRNFTVRYRGAALGLLWSIIPPLAQLFILVFLFGRVVPLGIEAYPAFVLTGLLPWTWFSSTVGSAGRVLSANADLLRRPNFSPVLLLVAEVLQHLLSYLILLPMLIVTLALYHRPLTPFLLAFPLLVLIQGILLVGLSLLIATLNVFYRDTQYLANLVASLLFYVTPVFYQAQSIRETYRGLYLLNPVAGMIEGYVAIFFYGRLPQWSSFLPVAVAAICIYGIGWIVYRWRLHEIYDEI